MIELTKTQALAMDNIASEKYSFILFGGAMGRRENFFRVVSPANNVRSIPEK